MGAVLPVLGAVLWAIEPASGAQPPAARAEPSFQQVILDNSYIAYERDVGDMDGDGRNDVVAIMEGDTTVQVFHAPAWRRSTLITFTGEYRYPRADDFKLADVDGDGDLDMVTRLGKGPSDDGAGIAVWCENPGGGSNFVQHLIGNSLEYVKDIVVSDFDRDGRLDVVMRMDSRTQLWLQEPGGPTPSSQRDAARPGGALRRWTEVLLTHPPHEGMEAGDLDGDGDPDLILNGYWFETPDTPPAARVAANYAYHVIDSAWFNQTGDWTKNSCKVVAGDFDGDGKNDVAFSHSERVGHAVAWYRSATPRVDGSWSKHTVAVVDYCHTLQAADFDLDGDVDLLAGGMIQSQHRGLRLMLNSGGGASWTESVIQTDGSYSAEIGDIDNDGDPDIVGIRNWNAAPSWIYRNDSGRLAFRPHIVDTNLPVAMTDRHPTGPGLSNAGAETKVVEPIRLHPENPHYFLLHDRPTILVTAGEHYGAVMNLDFDYLRYLDELKAHRFNLTRVFSGTYREVPGSFGITGNTLAPAAGRFACPWARSETPGASDGGNRFDLTRWDETYLDRLKDFTAQAGRRGVVVELVLFCTMYDDSLWNVSPMSAHNNVNGIGNLTRSEVYNAKDADLVAVQESVARKLVSELNEFDNLYYEVCNEPYERGGLTREWNDRIIAAIVETEASLPRKHLIAQGFPRSSKAIGDLNPHVSVLNFHAAKPDAVRLNYSLNRVVAFDETGGSDRSDRKYRTEGWEFILAGGGVYDHLDFSFTPQREDGTAVPLPPGTPGGGGPEIREQLALLKRVVESFDFIRMTPDLSIVRGPLPGDVSVQVLAERGRAYAIYLKGGTQADLALDLPGGSYGAEWIDTKTGSVAKAEQFAHGGGSRTLVSPVYSEDIALRVKRQPAEGAP